VAFLSYLVVVSLISGNAATGQTSTASLHGTVIDINGASVSDATLTLTNTEIEIGVTLTEKTDEEGAGAKPQTGAFTDSGGDMNEFKNPTAAIAAFDYPFPGGVGSRNVLRGPGYFGIDMALRREWNFTERQKLAFSWEVFNVTNSVRFDVFSALPAIDNSGSFGKYSQTLTGPRVMEFMLRHSF
jgi:hypothetical protein